MVIESDRLNVIRKVLDTVKDPEIPVISIVDLGIVRDIRLKAETVEVDITPTYSGCPALDVIPILIRNALNEAGFESVIINNIISPPWSTDWISEEGKARLRAFGISPPNPVSLAADTPLEERLVECPRCGSANTRLISYFGSTPCKAAFQCKSCLEPFDHFKCH